jgi:quercetin dioxygenase-like cupin family protein
MWVSLWAKPNDKHFALVWLTLHKRPAVDKDAGSKGIGMTTIGSDLAQAKLYSWAEVPLEQMNPLFTRQFVSGEKAMVAKIALKAGCVVPMHQHPNEQISLITSGAMEFVIGGESKLVKAGEVLVIPSGVPHSATAHEDAEGIDIFAPPRQDWLEKTDTYLR